MELRGKTALITGATGKIGSVLAEALAGEGVGCICHCHLQRSRSTELAERIERLNQRAMTVQADFTDFSQVREMFQKARDAGPIDLLIHTAGLFEKTPFRETAEYDERKIFDVNLTGPLLLTRLFVQSLGESIQGGRPPRAKILFFSDPAAARPWKGYAAYSASKAGIESVVKALAKELAPDLTVNAIAPGIIISFPFDPEEEKRQLQRIPMGRFGTLEEIAQTAIFLLRNDYITGQVIRVDGGRSIS